METRLNSRWVIKSNTLIAYEVLQLETRLNGRWVIKFISPSAAVRRDPRPRHRSVTLTLTLTQVNKSLYDAIIAPAIEAYTEGGRRPPPRPDLVITSVSQQGLIQTSSLHPAVPDLLITSVMPDAIRTSSGLIRTSSSPRMRMSR